MSISLLEGNVSTKIVCGSDTGTIFRSDESPSVADSVIDSSKYLE